jgi:hypothetical protein
MIMKRKHTLLILTLAVLFASAEGARAQFTMRAVGEDAVNPPVEIPLKPETVDVSVINDAQARVMRRTAWHQRNDVDVKASLTGMLTQYNQSWVKNNQNSISSELAFYYYHTYSLEKYTSTFKFDAIYGMNFIEDAWFKNQDLLSLYHLSSWKMRERGALRNWAYGFSAKFASQFSEGFKSRTEHELWSNFMAPGTFNVGLGLTYTSPNKKLPFIVTVNPVSGEALFVLDDRLSEARKKQLGLPEGSLVRYKIEGGSSVNIDFNRTFSFGNKGVTMQYITTLNSFYGWMTQLSRRPDVAGGVAPPMAIMPTVNWTNRLIVNPLKFLSLEFRTVTVYDRSQIDRVQMQYYLRVGLTYRYKNR